MVNLGPLHLRIEKVFQTNLDIVGVVGDPLAVLELLNIDGEDHIVLQQDVVWFTKQNWAQCYQHTVGIWITQS